MYIGDLWPQTAAFLPTLGEVNDNLQTREHYDKENFTLFTIQPHEIENEIDDESAISDTSDGFCVSKSDQEGSFLHTALCNSSGTIIGLNIDGVEILLDDYLEMYS